MGEVILSTDGQIKGACMAKLLEHITLCGENGTDGTKDTSRLISDLLFMHKTFSTHSELFDALIERFRKAGDAKTETLNDVQKKVIDIIQQWITLYPDDWAQDAKLRAKAKSFLDDNPAYTAQLEQLVNQVTNTKKKFVKLYNAWEIDKTPTFNANKSDLLAWDPKDLAKEMFLFDASVFIEVHRTEFIGLLRKSEELEHFNRLEAMGQRRIDWVASELYRQPADQATKKFKAIVALLEACLEYNNLFAASNILLGLQGESMNKLSGCWEQGPMKILACAKSLNDKVKQLQILDNKNTIYIPHLELLREQLQRISENTDTLAPNVINIQFVKRLAEMLMPIYVAAQKILESTPPFQFNLTARYFLANLKTIANRSSEDENNNPVVEEEIKRKKQSIIRRNINKVKLGRLFGLDANNNVNQNNQDLKSPAEEISSAIDLRSSSSFLSFERQCSDIDMIIETRSQKSDDSNLRLVKFKELLKTESNYVYCLAFYVNNNLSELKMRKICSQKKIDVLTGNIEQILHFHRSFLDALKTEFLTWCDQTEVGAIFLNFHRYFFIYIDFVINFDQASEVVEKLRMKNKYFSELDERLKNEDESQNLDFASILIRPVQRIPRYILLLEEILKGTNKSHNDYKKLKDALHKMKCTAERINAAKKQKQQKQRALQLVKILTGTPSSMNLSSEQRSLVAEHKLLLVKDKEVLPVTLLIYSDCLLVAKDVSATRMEFLALFDVFHAKLKKSTAEDVKRNYQASVPDREFFVEIHHRKRVYIFAVESRVKQKDIAFEYNLVMKHYHNRYWRILDPEPTTPKPRVGHSTAIINEKIYLFGGFDTQKIYFNGLHMLDINSGVWEDIKPTDGFTPPQLAYHTCSAVGYKLYIFGGTTREEKYFNDLYEVTLSEIDLTANWRRVPLVGDVPKPRAYHSATVVDDKIYIFGGMINEGTYSTYFDDIHVIDPVNGTSDKIDIVKMTVAVDERTPRGSSDMTSSDESVRSRNSLDSSRPSSTSQSEDSVRSRSSFDSTRSSMVGSHSDKSSLGSSRKRSSTLTLPEFPENAKKKDRKKLEKEAKKGEKKKHVAASAAVPVVQLSTSPNTGNNALLSPRKDSHPSKRQKTLSLARKPNYPYARCMHASVAIGHEIYYFGGKDQNNTPLKEMFVFDTITKLFRRIRRATGFVPMARYGATAHSLTDETFLLFGGTNTEHSFGEYFIFNTVKNSWQKGVVEECHLSPRNNHTIHVVGDSMWVFAGFLSREGQIECTNEVLVLNNIYNHIDDPELYLKTRKEPKKCQLVTEHYSGIKKYRYKVSSTNEPHSDDSYVFKTMNKENQELLLIIDDQHSEIELLKLKNIELEKKNIDLFAQLEEMKRKLAVHERI